MQKLEVLTALDDLLVYLASLRSTIDDSDECDLVVPLICERLDNLSNVLKHNIMDWSKS